MVFLDSTGNQTAIYNSNNISFYKPINMFNNLIIYKSDRTIATVGFGDSNVTFNIPVICNADLTATNIYNKTDIDTALAKKQNNLIFDNTLATTAVININGSPGLSVGLSTHI